MDRIRIGQIGIGHNHGIGKMGAVRKFPELFEVVGYSEENPEWIERRGENPKYAGLPRLSREELIDRCDALLVETDVWDLTKTAQLCIDAGKHIHMDKPASGTLEEYRHLLDTAQEKNLVVQLGYMYRYNPGIMKAIELAKSGALGEITMINAEMSTFHEPPFRRWLQNYPGGIMYILGSHLLDLSVYLMGEPDNITTFLKHSGKDGIDVADNDLAVLEYGNALVRIFVSSVERNGYGRRQFFISGTEGAVDVRPIERPLHVTYAHPGVTVHTYADEKEILPIPDLPDGCRYDGMMQDFYAYIKGTKENPFTYAHEYTVQKLLYRICGIGENEYPVGHEIYRKNG